MYDRFSGGRWVVGFAVVCAVVASIGCSGFGTSGEAEASPDAPDAPNDAPVERKRGRGRRATAPAPAPQPAPGGGGGGGTGQGSVAYAKYDSGSKLISFVSDRSAKVTWQNMTGSAVSGTFTQSGDEIVVQWDPNADNYGSLETRFHQTSACSLSQYWRKDKQGVVHDDESTVYVRQTPECLRR